MLLSLATLCYVAKRQHGLAPTAALRKFFEAVEDATERRSLSGIGAGTSKDAAWRRAYRKLKQRGFTEAELRKAWVPLDIDSFRWDATGLRIGPGA
jgi:hypothetical protein